MFVITGARIAGAIGIRASFTQSNAGKRRWYETRGWQMITEFITKHGITMYRLSKLLDIPETTVRRWAKSGPQHPEIMRRALADMERELTNT